MDEELNAAVIKSSISARAEDHVWNTCPAITTSSFTCDVVLIISKVEKS